MDTLLIFEGLLKSPVLGLYPANMQTPQDPLDSSLARWRDAPPPLPAPVGPEVWRRLATTTVDAPKLGLLARVIADFARPAFAATFITACTFLGLFLAEVRLSHLRAARDRQLVQSYLYLIDPLIANADPRGAPTTPPRS
jgi:hypothetical protein